LLNRNVRLMRYHCQGTVASSVELRTHNRPTTQSDSLRVVALFSASTVTSTSAPFLRRTSLPSSSVNEFSMRISWYRVSAPSTDISAFSGSLGSGDLMIFSTFPGRVTFGFSVMRSPLKHIRELG